MSEFEKVLEKAVNEILNRFPEFKIEIHAIEVPEPFNALVDYFNKGFDKALEQGQQVDMCIFAMNAAAMEQMELVFDSEQKQRMRQILCECWDPTEEE